MCVCLFVGVCVNMPGVCYWWYGTIQLYNFLLSEYQHMVTWKELPCSMAWLCANALLIVVHSNPLDNIIHSLYHSHTTTVGLFLKVATCNALLCYRIYAYVDTRSCCNDVMTSFCNRCYCKPALAHMCIVHTITMQPTSHENTYMTHFSVNNTYHHGTISRLSISC